MAEDDPKKKKRKGSGPPFRDPPVAPKPSPRGAIDDPLVAQYLLEQAAEGGMLEPDPLVGAYRADPMNQPEFAGSDANAFVTGLRKMGRRILPSVGQSLQSLGESVGSSPIRAAGSWIEEKTHRRPLVGRVPRMGDVVSRDEEGNVEIGPSVVRGIDWGLEQVGSGVASTLPMLGLAYAGQPGAALAAGASLNIGESRESMLAAGVDPEDVGEASLATGAAMTGLDYLPVGRLAGKMRRGAIAAVTPGVGPAAAVRRVLTETAKQGAFEGVTEGAQTVVQEGGKFAALGRMPTLEEAKAAGFATIEAAVAGGLTGGAMGGVTQGVQEIRQGVTSLEDEAVGRGRRTAPAAIEMEIQSQIERNRETIDRANGVIDRTMARRQNREPDPYDIIRPEGKPREPSDIKIEPAPDGGFQFTTFDGEVITAPTQQEAEEALQQFHLDYASRAPEPVAAPAPVAAAPAAAPEAAQEAAEPQQAPAAPTPQSEAPAPRTGAMLPLSESELETVADLTDEQARLTMELPDDSSDPRYDEIADRLDELETAINDILGSAKHEDETGVPFTVPNPKGSPIKEYEEQFLNWQHARNIASGEEVAPEEDAALVEEFRAETGTAPEIDPAVAETFKPLLESGFTLPSTPIEVNPDSRLAGSDPSAMIPEGAQANYLAAAQQAMQQAGQFTNPEFLQKFSKWRRGETMGKKESDAIAGIAKSMSVIDGTLGEIADAFGPEAAAHVREHIATVFPEAWGAEGILTNPEAGSSSEPGDDDSFITNNGRAEEESRLALEDRRKLYGEGAPAAELPTVEVMRRVSEDPDFKRRVESEMERAGSTDEVNRALVVESVARDMLHERSAPASKARMIPTRQGLMVQPVDEQGRDIGDPHPAGSKPERRPSDLVPPNERDDAALLAMFDRLKKDVVPTADLEAVVRNHGARMKDLERFRDSKGGLSNLPADLHERMRAIEAIRMALRVKGIVPDVADPAPAAAAAPAKPAKLKKSKKDEGTSLLNRLNWLFKGPHTVRGQPIIGISTPNENEAILKLGRDERGFDLQAVTVEGDGADMKFYDRETGDEIVPLAPAPGLPAAEAPAPKADVVPHTKETAKTGEPFEDDVYRGEGATWTQGRGEDSILGSGRYSAFDEKGAQVYAIDADGRMVGSVTKLRVRLSNPLVIDTDMAWKALTKEAGWPFPLPRPGTDETALGIAKLRGLIQSRGHDGVIVRIQMVEAGFGSDRMVVNEAKGKTLDKVFGTSTVLEFDPPASPQSGTVAAVRQAKSMRENRQRQIDAARAMLEREQAIVDKALSSTVKVGDEATIPGQGSAIVTEKDEDIVVLKPEDGPATAITWAGAEDAEVEFGPAPAAQATPAGETTDDGRDEVDGGARGDGGRDSAPAAPQEVLPGDGEEAGTAEPAGDVSEGRQRGGRGGARSGDVEGSERGEPGSEADARGGEVVGDAPDEGDSGEGSEGAGTLTFPRAVTDPGDATVGVHLSAGALASLIPRGTAARIRHNIAVVRLLRRLESEGRRPTWDEKRTMLGWVGWGGAWQVFEDKKEPHKSAYEADRAELQELLGPEAYAAARASTINAHYTSEEVVRGLHAIVERFGAGARPRVLEPSAGIGHFLTMAPEALAGARWTAVELDPTTGAILEHLHPDQDVRVQGFQHMKGREGSFDLVVGNVPFGDYSVADKQYDHLKVNIHNYFIAKAIDQVRPGGVVAVITSAFTLDSRKGQKFREYLGERAHFLGAIRLPETAFKGNASTEVVTDIVLLQRKVEGVPAPVANPWFRAVPVDVIGGGKVTVNEYFSAHPEHVLGTFSTKGTMYAKDSMTVEPRPGMDLVQALEAVVESFPENIIPDRPKHEATDDAAVAEKELAPSTAPLRARLREGELGFDAESGAFVLKQGGELEPYTVPKAHAERLKSYLGLRDLYRDSLALQRSSPDDATIKESIAATKKAYEKAVKKFGPITLRKVSPKGAITMPNLAGLPATGSDRPLLMSLESATEVGSEVKYTPSRALSERTLNVKPEMRATTAQEALTLSLAHKGVVDLDWMGSQIKKSSSEVRRELKDRIYWNPMVSGFETDNRFLSGDVREKLEATKHAIEEGAPHQNELEESRAALEKAMPTPLKPEEIGIEPGASFIPERVYTAFSRHLFGVPLNIRFVPIDSSWSVEVSGGLRKGAASLVQWGTDRVPGTDLFEKILNGRSVVVRDKVQTEMGEKSVKNPAETQKAIAKMDAIRDEWQRWLQSDEKRLKSIADAFNEQMTRYQKREFDGSYLLRDGGLPGTSQYYKNRPFSWLKHQVDAIARILEMPATLLAHAVGAGKTFTIAGAMMEGRRLGKFRRPMVVVPSHLVEQFASEWQSLYPEAKLLVAGKDQITKPERQALAARIVSGDWDGIIISHSSFSRMGMSPDFTRRAIGEEVEAIRQAIENERDTAGKKNDTVKRLEAALKRAEASMERMISAFTKDELLAFDELGIDALTVDEAHLYKNLWAFSRRQDVSVNFTARAFDMFLKTKHLHETKGTIVFSTGTPVSNALYEVHAMMRYLQPDDLGKIGARPMDGFLDKFASIVTKLEMSPEGGRFRSKQRVARYNNLLPLIAAFSQVADVKMASDLWPEPTDEQVKAGFKRMRPPLSGGRPKIMMAKATAVTKSYIRHLMGRADAVRAGQVDPSVDNMLKITSEGRKLALDPRLIDPRAGKPENGVIEQAADSITRIWRESGEYKGAQLVFSDLGVPRSAADKRKALDKEARREAYEEELTRKGMSEDEIAEKMFARFGHELDDTVEYADEGAFSVYDDLKAQLIERGIPANQIAFIHEANTDLRKAELFKKVNAGLVRVLVGSTEKMGAGTNVQERLVHLHHLDVPWRPSDVEQREGRIIRQGNELFNTGKISGVGISRYITEGTFSTYMWETVERKAGFIGQLWTGAGVNVIDELGGAIELTAAEIKAVASGNPLALDVAGLKQDVAQAEQKVKAARASKESAHRKLTRYRGDLGLYEKQAEGLAIDVKAWKPTKGDEFAMTIEGKKYDERPAAAEHLEKLIREAIKRVRVMLGRKESSDVVGELGGFPVTLRVRQDIQGEFETTVTMEGKSKLEYEARGASAAGLIASMERTGGSIDSAIEQNALTIERLKSEISALASLEKVDIEADEKKLRSLRTELDAKQAELEASGEGDNVVYEPTLPERSSVWWEATRNGEIPYKRTVRSSEPRADEDDGIVEMGGVMDPFSAAVLAFRALRKQSRSQSESFGSLWEPTDEEVRARMEQADGLMRKPAVAKLKEAWGRMKSGLRHFAFLDEKASPLNAQLYEILLQVERAPAAARTQAFNLIARVSEGLGKEEGTLLARWLAVQDIQKDVEAGLYGDPDAPATMRELPFGFDVASLEEAHRELGEAVANAPKVAAAVKKREDLTKTLTRELVLYDLLPESVLDDPRYYHRQVLTFFNAVDDDAAWAQGLLTGSGQRVQVGKRGYQQSRVGGSDFNLRYSEAEFEWLSQAFRQLHTVKALQRIEGMADIRRELSAEARSHNREAWREQVLGPIRRQMEAAHATESEIEEVLADADPSLPYRRRKAIGFRRLYDGIASGLIDLPSRYTSFAESLLAALSDHRALQEAGESVPFDFHHPDLWRVLSDLAQSDNEAGSIAARTVFKAIREEESAMKRSLGAKYIERSDPASLMKLAPEGYTTWQPVKGNYFYRAVSIEQRVVDEILAGDRALQSEDVRAVMAIGGPKETWIIPGDLAAQLEKFSERRDKSVLEAAFSPISKRWKWWTLHAPHRFLKYSMNNVFGDLDATVLYPKVLTFAPTAASDLSKAARAPGKADPALMDELERLQLAGVIGNTLTIAEIPDVSQLPEFSNLVKADPLQQMNVFGRYVHMVDTVNLVRENVLRLAAYRFALAEIKAGRPLAGASDRKVMSALQTDEERAALFARDLLGDYLAVSRAGQALAAGPMPFFRWVEINAKRYVNLAKNIRYEGELRASGVAKAAGFRTGVFTVAQAARVAVLANSFLVLAALWNALMFPEEDETLRRQGITGYIIVGRTPEGDIIRIRAEGAFADFLNWASLGDWPGIVQDIRDGGLEVGEVIADALWAPVNRAYSLWDPFTKEIAEQVLGKRGWPDVRDPRPVRERGIGAGLANVFGLKYVYRRATGRPVPPGAAPLSWILYRTDAQESSYFITRDLVREYRREAGKTVGNAPLPDERSNALYYHRQALRYGDSEAAERWLKQYYLLGGTRAGARRSVLSSTHPLSGIPMTERGRFRRSLTSEERALVETAEQYWNETYRRARPASPRSLGVSGERAIP